MNLGIKTCKMVILQTGFLVTLMISVANGQACPERCDCKSGQGGTIVHCKYQRKNGFPPLQEFPEDTVELDYGHNNITILSSIPPLRNLQRLFLDNCQIRTIGAFAFSNAPSLTNITLKHNTIDSINGKAFGGLPNLQGLYMEENELTSLPDSVFNSLNLVELYLDGSSIHTLSDETFTGLTVQHLYMKRNNISRLTDGFLNPLKESLVSFHLDDNGRNLFIDAKTFEGFNNLEALSLRSSKMMDVGFLNFTTVNSLYLSGNMFPELDLSPYEGLQSVETLELSNMGLNTFQANKILRNLSYLRKLDLSNNGILRLESDWFQRTPRLSDLNLSGNKLKELPTDFSQYLVELTSLDLSMNELIFLKYMSFSQMSKVTRLDFTRNKIRVFSESLKPLFTRVTHVHLLDNPLHCSCEMLWYRQWLDTLPNGNVATICYSPINTYIYNLLPEQFVCTPPAIVSIEPLIYIPPGEDLFLYCAAEGDPAPVMKWMDHYNESITVSPPEDRSNFRNSIAWQLNSVTEEYTGIYRCTASSLAGTVTAETKVVVTDTIPTTTPQPTTTTTTPATTLEPNTTLSNTSPTDSASQTSIFTKDNLTAESVPSKKPTTIKDTTTKSEAFNADVNVLDQKTLAIIIGTLGGFLILCVLLFLIVHVMRHTKHKRRYEVNDKAVIYHHDTNELDISKDSKQINV